MFPCETCGHPLNLHDPCNAVVGSGKKAHLCGCPRFEPQDLKGRVASLTDTAQEKPVHQLASELAAAASKGARA